MRNLNRCIAIVSALVLVVSFSAAADRPHAEKSEKEKSETSKKSDHKSKSDKGEKSESSASGHSASGTVTVWNEAAREFTVADTKGKQWSFGWNPATKLEAAPKVGENVNVRYTADKAGKMWATRIRARAKKSAPRSTYGNK